MSGLLTLLFHDVHSGEPDASGFTGAAAARYKLGVDEFERQLEGLARERIASPRLLPDAAAAATALAEDAALAITVDDGGVAYAELVADRLERRGWRGHCFVTTERIGRRGFLSAAQLRDLHGRGHVVGSHSVSHPARFAALAPARQQAEWRDSRAALEDVIGAAVRVGSLPGGDYAAAVARHAATAGIEVLFTSEPRLGGWRVPGCVVLGRHALRRGAAPDRCARLVRRGTALLAAEWLAWNARKPVKACLRSGYPRLAGWMAGVVGA